MTAAYPLDLINASVCGMRSALEGLREGRGPPPELTLPFEELQVAHTANRHLSAIKPPRMGRHQTASPPPHRRLAAA